VSADPSPADGMPDQTSLDQPDVNNGTWSSLAGGTTARPYVTDFSVINEGVTTSIITGGTTTAETGVTPGRLAVSIGPYNLCKSGQSPAPGVCYSTPNRIGITIGYQIQPGQLGYNFSSPAVPLLEGQAVNENTEFDMTLNLNTLGKTLRWTWANGIPTYWKLTNLGSDTATLRIRLKPVLMPRVSNGGGCSQVPVGACEYTQSLSQYLSANLVLSLDSTLDPVFTGALFTSSRAYMGSLDTVPGEAPQMTYGISAPKTWSDGSQNASSLYAVLSDAAILNFYGATSDVASTSGFQSSALSLSRTDGGSQGAVSWTRWAEDAQGTDGWLIEIPNIKFVLATSSSAVRAAGVHAFASKVAAAKFKVKQKTSPVFRPMASGTRTRASFRVTASACQKYTCRVVFSSISSKLSKKATKLTTYVMPRKTSSVSASPMVNAKRGKRLSVVVQAKKGSKWVYVSSAMATSK
jgi:hypothetical protein